MPKLTIITINFNHLDGLKRTIDSIVNQTFPDYEWIVVDGGSTDGSRQLLEQYQDRFAWWCSEKDKGVYNAMNKGLQHASGEYVFATPTILTEIFSKPHDVGILYGIMTRGTLNGEFNNKLLLKSHISWWDFYFSTFNHQATFTKRVLFLQYGGYDETYKALADWRHFAELICVHRVSYEYIPKIIAVYEGHGISDNVDIFPNEINRIHQEVYPAMQYSDFVELQNVEMIKNHKFTRLLYKILIRGAKCVIKDK